MTIAVLNWMEVPGSLGIERDRIVPFEYRNADFDEEYDFRALFYDAIFVPQRHCRRISTDWKYLREVLGTRYRSSFSIDTYGRVTSL